jgi:fatty-acyl-CoA synthase
MCQEVTAPDSAGRCPEVYMIEPWYERTNKTWGAALLETVEKYPDNELIVYKDQRVSYAQFYFSVQSLAAGLLRIGVRRGEPTAVWMTNCVEWMLAQFAAYQIGSPLVPINTRFAREEVGYALEQSNATTLVLRDRFLGEKVDTLQWLQELIPEIASAEPGELASKRFPRLKRVICLGERKPRGAYAFGEVPELGNGWKKSDALSRVALAVNPFDVVNIIYTSGTTGFPKGGLSMHRNNMAATYHTAERTDLRPTDKIYLGVPFATNLGCAYVSQISVLTGNSIVVHETFNPAAALETIEREKISWFPGAPTMFIMMLNQPELAKYDLKSLRTALVGGAACPAPTIRAMKEKLRFKYVLQCYGLSECGGISTCTLRDDPIEKTAATVGVALPSSRVRVVDPKTGEDSALGEQGEIWLGDVYPGSCVGKGYYNMPDKTAETITPEGWFRTGDLGAFDPDGYLRITGRLKEMYIAGGFNIYPVEIEAVLHAHPKVKMAQVFGVPDQRLGEVGCGFIELKPGEVASEEEIIAFCKERMANYKVPRYVRFVTVSDFPLTSSGKVQKFKLQERMIKELRLDK